MVERIVEYIQLNRATYTRDAITQKLIDEGYNEHDIEAAWRIVEDANVEHRNPVERPVYKRWEFWVIVVSVVAVVYWTVYLGFYSGLVDKNLCQLAAWLIVGLQIVLLVISFGNRFHRKILSKGIIYGLVFADLIVPIFLLLGSCLYWR
jgi:hypothetical protein